MQLLQIYSVSVINVDCDKTAPMGISILPGERGISPGSKLLDLIEEFIIIA